MVKKDTRLHIPVKDTKLQEQIKNVIETHGLTYEQFLKKYLNIPTDEFEIVADKYSDFEKDYKSHVQNENKKHVDAVLSYTWVILANIAKGKFNASSYIKNIENNFESGIYLTDPEDHKLRK